MPEDRRINWAMVPNRVTIRHIDELGEWGRAAYIAIPDGDSDQAEYVAVPRDESNSYDPFADMTYVIDDDLVDEVAPQLPPSTPATPPRWRPKRGDLVTMVADGSGTWRTGELGVVADTYPSLTVTGNSAIDVTVAVIRPAPDTDSRDHYVAHFYADDGAAVPVEPDTFGQLVRCHSHTGAHPHIGSCTRATRMVSYCDDQSIQEALMADYQVRWALEIAVRQARVSRVLARFSNLRIGQRIHITGGRYRGYLAEVREAVRTETRDVMCMILYSDGEYMSGMVAVSLFYLGEPVREFFLGSRVPRYLAFQTVAYSGPTVATDRPIVDSADVHECSHRCFNYGCVVDYRGHDDDDDDTEYLDGVPIHSYSYRPELIFSGDGPVFLGTELELSTGSGSDGSRKQAFAAQVATSSQIGHLTYLKSDASIEGFGFEMVFHPMSYNWLVDNWPEDLLRRLRGAGALPHHSCGMHVHVGRTGFTDAPHTYRWIKFMYRNASYMKRLARRDPGTYGSFDGTEERAAAKFHAKGAYGSANRYAAVNCMPPNTLEVRIFASTLNHTRFLGSLGLVDAGVEYTRQINAHDILTKGAWEFDPFRDYVHSFEKYKPLQLEMKRILGK